MMSGFKRAVVPVLLLAIGVTLIVVGGGFHSREVLAQVEQKAPKIPDINLNRPAWMQAPVPVASGPRYVATWLQESEPVLIKEITVGGLALASDGRIKRTYSGDMPSLCPT